MKKKMSSFSLPQEAVAMNEALQMALKFHFDELFRNLRAQQLEEGADRASPLHVLSIEYR